MTVERCALPGELFLDGIVQYPARLLDSSTPRGAEGDWGKPERYDDETRERAKHRGPYVALRWVLNPALGMPVEPFVVWRRPAYERGAAQSIPGWRRAGDTFVWDGVTEMLRLEIELSGTATVTGLHRADLAPVQVVSGNAGDTVVLDAGPMLAVRVDNPGAVADARGQSVNQLANEPGWRQLEVVGLPFTPQQLGSVYYQGASQGPVSAPTDPVDAAVQRLERWGPVLGWAPLAGLDPWRPPEAGGLVREVQGDLLADLAQVLAAYPPPQVAAQLTAEAQHALDEAVQLHGTRAKAFNTGRASDDSSITIRPLQALASSVATDTWAALALGFGTGDVLSHDDEDGGGDDYMVTAVWDGVLKRSVPQPFPWPFGGGPPPVVVEVPVTRELVAIKLRPSVRQPPPPPTPFTSSVGHDDGADDRDEPYRVSAVLQTARGARGPGQPRTAGFGLARFDAPGQGSYQLREHPVAGGLVPIGAAAPVRTPGTPPDPGTVPDTVTLRNSSLPRPISGAPIAYEYYLAATDLFGQWGPWSPSWLSVPALPVRAPLITSVHARATGTADPCALTVDADVVWDFRERSLGSLELQVDLFPPTPAPPAPHDPPPDTPQGGAVTIASYTIECDADGTPTSVPAGLDVVPVDEDDNPVAPGQNPDELRYRVTITGLTATFSGRPELAVAVYARATETIRPGEWSDWTHPREAAVVGNPIPPPPAAPLPVEYPVHASLPDPAGRSYASVSWVPFGAWRYRVYEATEAALLAACGRPGPVLTDGYGARMQALFDLYAMAANRTALKKAYRKLGHDPLLPPVGADGRMRFEALLPRGSSLIHCFVVVGVSENNQVSPWPEPDADGRQGFDAFAIPHLRRVAQPQVRGRLDPVAGPELTVLLDGPVPATAVLLHRCANAVLARSVGTMGPPVLSGPPVAAPDGSMRAVFTDAGAPTGWSRLQYRAVALTADVPDRAGMAVPSEPSRSYALLNPPPDPPALTLTADVAGSTAAVSLVRVDTDALRHGSDVGDFTVAVVIDTPGAAPQRFSSALGGVPELPDAAALAAGSAQAAYVGGVLHLRVPRPAGQPATVAVDVADPLSRSTHAVTTVPDTPPDPPPAVSFTAGRLGGVVALRIDTNVPQPPDPSHDWTLTFAGTRVFNFPPHPTPSRSFAVSQIPAIHSEAEMPNPATDPATFEIRRLAGSGRILLWSHAAANLRVTVRLTNPAGESTTSVQVVP